MENIAIPHEDIRTWSAVIAVEVLDDTGAFGRAADLIAPVDEALGGQTTLHAPCPPAACQEALPSSYRITALTA